MKSINRQILEQLIAASAGPVLVLRTDQPDWPVVFVNAAFEALGPKDARRRPFADVVASFDDAHIVVLSHSSKQWAVEAFASRIPPGVRNLGLHHPRASAARFVTVSYRVGVVQGAAEREASGAFVDRLLTGGSE